MEARSGRLSQAELDKIAKERRREQYLRTRNKKPGKSSQRIRKDIITPGTPQKNNAYVKAPAEYGVHARKRNAEEISRLKRELASERRKHIQSKKKLHDYQMQTLMKENSLKAEKISLEKRSSMQHSKLQHYRKTMMDLGERAKNFQGHLVRNFDAFDSDVFLSVWNSWESLVSALNGHGFGPTPPHYEELEKIHGASSEVLTTDEEDVDDDNWSEYNAIENVVMEDVHAVEEDAYHALQKRSDLIQKHGRHAKYEANRTLDTTLGLPRAKQKARATREEVYDRMLALDDGEEEGEGEDEEDEDNDEGDGDLIAIDPRIEALFASYAPKDENKIDSATFTLIVRNMGLFRSWSLSQHRRGLSQQRKISRGDDGGRVCKESGIVVGG